MLKEIKKEEIKAILKQNGLTEEQAEQVLELIAKGLGGSIIDLAGLVVGKIENETVKMIANMAFGALAPKAKEAVKAIEVNL